MKKVLKAVLPWAILGIFVVSIYYFFIGNQEPIETITYTKFSGLLEKGIVEEITINDKGIEGTLSKEARTDKDAKPFKQFKTKVPVVDTEFVKKLEAADVKIDVKDGHGLFWTILITVGPYLLLFVFFIWLFRRMQGPNNKAMSFGKSKAQFIDRSTIKINFGDVAGADEAKDELEEIIDFLKNPRKFQRLGGKIPKGVLLVGPPGCGKTLLAKAVAGEAGVPFLSISGSDFVEMFVGVGAARVRDLFDQALKSAPCIIFVDELDAVGRLRGAGVGGGHDEREQTLNQLLVEMDGFKANEGVIMLAATNRPDILDPALLRPGRFDRQVVVDRPDLRGRIGILKVHSRNIPLSDGVNLEDIARGTPYFSGADLSNLINEAALLAARRDKDEVEMEDMWEARDKVMMGPERRSHVISDTDKKVAAFHEAGHAMVGMLAPGADPVHKVTIIPRGMALGLTQSLPEEDRHMYNEDYCNVNLSVLLGGRAAEMLVFSIATSGAGNDIEKATELARHMVCDWGMSKKLGTINYGQKNENIFLGREISQHRDYSEQTAQMIDEEIRRIVDEAYDRSYNLLKKNRELLEKLGEQLLERETLNRDELEMLREGQELPPLKSNERLTKEVEPAAEAALERSDDGIGDAAPQVS